MFYQTFLSPQVKRCAIITYKHDIFNFPRDLPNNERLKILDCSYHMARPQINMPHHQTNAPIPKN